jgi:hypothetical protein
VGDFSRPQAAHATAEAGAPLEAWRCATLTCDVDDGPYAHQLIGMSNTSAWPS